MAGGVRPRVKSKRKGTDYNVRVQPDCRVGQKNVKQIINTHRLRLMLDAQTLQVSGENPSLMPLSSPPRPFAWEDAGGAVIDAAATSTRIDFIAFTAERHGGNKDHMRQYLEWEMNLVNQLDEQERGVFTVLAP